MGDGPRRPGKTRFSRSWRLILSPSWEAVYHSDDDIDDFDDHDDCDDGDDDVGNDGFAEDRTF